MGELMARRFQSLKMPPFDAIVPTPLCRKRLLQRGYNQAELLARSTSEALGIPLMADALLRTKTTPPQVGKNAAERKKFPSDAFKAPHKLPPLRIVLVDDVVTTGATASAASGALLDAGASTVVALCFAR
jgi:ComF family protein